MSKNFKPSALQKELMRVLRDMVSDKDGNIDPLFAGAFVHVQLDEDGFPYFQTLNGVLSFDKIDPLWVVYSPNLGSEPGSICVELSNFCKCAAVMGTHVEIGAPHYIDETTGAFSTGQAAFDNFRHNMRMTVLKDLADRKAESEKNEPKILVPNQDIILK